MSFKDQFNKSAGDDDSHEFELDTPSSLYVCIDGARTSIYSVYNFATRMVYVGENYDHAIPFKDIDREVLEAMHAKLRALGGEPPELPIIDNQGSIFQNKAVRP